MGDTTLTSATRNNLLSLQSTTKLIGRTQERLATGLKVNSAIDDALAFFKARNLNARASNLSAIKNNIANGVDTIKAAIHGLEAIEGVLKSMKALAQSAVSAAESSTRAKLAGQYNDLLAQIDNLAEDASFNGLNLLKRSKTPAALLIQNNTPAGSDWLTVKFNEHAEANAVNQLVVNGLTTAEQRRIYANSAQATGAVGNTNVWGQTGVAAVAGINAAIRSIDSALATVRQSAETFGSASILLSTRQDFTSNLINTLKGGASQLVNADLNEESANLLSFQTRQELGTISLSIAQESEQSILRLF